MFAFGVLLIGMELMRLNLTALQQPGPLERRVANLVKHAVIRRASRNGIPPPPPGTISSEAGLARYNLDCGTCHGSHGLAQTASGRWMYPRAADLTSQEVQSYSDQELFWIINNGIRFTGMPGFAKVETPNHIWSLVSYVRTLPSTE